MLKSAGNLKLRVVRQEYSDAVKKDGREKTSCET